MMVSFPVVIISRQLSESPFWLGRSASRVLCESCSSYVHELQVRSRFHLCTTGETQLRALETLGVAREVCVHVPTSSHTCRRTFEERGNVALVSYSRPSGETRPESLMSFLKSEVENGANRHEIRVFSLEAPGVPNHRRRSETRSRRAIPTSAGLDNCKSGKNRVFCEGSHTSENSPKAEFELRGEEKFSG